MNILIGLCVANIKDIMMQKEDFKLGQMIINNVNTEVNKILKALYYQKLYRYTSQLGFQNLPGKDQIFVKAVWSKNSDWRNQCVNYLPY